MLAGNLNFAREIINDGLTTALVMEVDADWDIDLKNQLTLFAQGSQYITKVDQRRESFPRDQVNVAVVANLKVDRCVSGG